MFNKKPPFEITSFILDKIAEISELIGQINALSGLSASPMLRRTNRIRSIYSSLAIEQNSLSLEQVTAVLNGKRVLAPPKDIAEVKNAYEIYEMLDTLDPYSVEHLLDAHGVLTRGLIEQSGCFRSGSVGVVDQDGNILHFGSLHSYVPDLTMELLSWIRDSKHHMLLKSCVFHYELELIHPFADGNGRIGRLWHTLLLSKWKPIFAWLPVESIIHDHQKEYYDAINRANNEGHSTAFIEFMLSAIQEALLEATQTGTSEQDKTEFRWRKMESFIQKHGFITNADVCRMFQVSSATATRILAKLTAEEKLQKTRSGKTWAYILPK